MGVRKAGLTMAMVSATLITGAAAAVAAPVEARGLLSRLEARYDARLGVYAVDTGTGRAVAYRPDERFAFASTYKALAAAALLERTEPADLERVVRYTAADVVDYSPITGPRAGQGMPLSEVAAAAVRNSDNTAGNLLFRELGGSATG